MRDGWRDVAVEEVAQVVGGGTPKSGVAEFWGGDVQWLTPKDLSDRPARYTSSGARTITEAGLRGSGAKVLPPGAVLLTSRAPVGYVSIASGPVATNQGFKSLLVDETQLPEFWYYLLGHSTEYLRANSGGSTFQELSGGSLKKLRFVVPPLVEQQRIVDLISAVDACIAAADGSARSAVAWYESGALRLQQSGEKTPLSVLVRTARAGGTPSRKEPLNYGGQVPWVKSGEVAGRVVVTTEETITETALARSAAWLVPSGATLVAMYGATAGQVGRLGLDAATNQAVLALLADPTRTDPDYLYHLMRSDGPHLKTLAKGAAQPNLSKGVLTSQAYVVPDLARQRELAQEMDAALAVCEAAQDEAQQLRGVRSNLLTSLLSGEHEIPDSYDELLAG